MSLVLLDSHNLQETLFMGILMSAYRSQQF